MFSVCLWNFPLEPGKAEREMVVSHAGKLNVVKQTQEDKNFLPHVCIMTLHFKKIFLIIIHFLEFLVKSHQSISLSRRHTKSGEDEEGKLSILLRGERGRVKSKNSSLWAGIQNKWIISDMSLVSNSAENCVSFLS